METNFKKYLKIIQESKNETINESSELSPLVALLNELSPFKKYGNKLNAAKTPEDKTAVIEDVIKDANISDQEKQEILDKVAENYKIFHIQPDTFSGVTDKLKRMVKELFFGREPREKTKMDVNLP